MRDSMTIVQTKLGETLAERGSLILDKRELEDALGISHDQIKSYEKTLGSKLAYISKLESQLQVKDTITLTKVVHDTLSNSYTGSYNDKWMSFNQKFILDKNPRFEVYDISMNVPLKVGLTNDYTIFVTSPNPYFHPTDIEGAVIDGSRFTKKQRRLNIGLYGGVGIGYGMIGKQLDIGPQVGVGIGYRIL